VRAVFVDSDVLRESRFPDARAAREQADWLSWLEIGGLRTRTLDDYSWATDRLLEAFPSRRFKDFTDGDLLYVLRRFPPRSRRVRLAAFRSWFLWGVKTRRLNLNPVDLLPKIQRVPPTVISVFNEKEVRALKTLPTPAGQLMTILFELGLRKGEARHLRVEDFDFDRREVNVRRGTKGGKERVVVLSHECAHAIVELVTLEGLNPGDYLWATRPGGGRIVHDRPIGNSGFQIWWGTALANARVKYRKPHTTRHTYATTWRERGLPLDDLQLMLGHASIQTTSDLYVHTQVRDVRRRMEELTD
jgi:integrase/recombinase XerD